MSCRPSHSSSTPWLSEGNFGPSTHPSWQEAPAGCAQQHVAVSMVQAEVDTRFQQMVLCSAAA